ncbi:MAG TPA: hypothetical protein VIC30_12345 [Orrella sp.]
MASGDTKLSICSDALIMLGASPLSSFSDGTDAAQICDRLYDDLKDTLVASYPWSWSFKKAQLARLSEEPVNEWKYNYALPGDRLSGVRAVFNSGSSGARSIQSGWEILGDKLQTSEEQIYIDYQYSPQEFELPTYFVQLLKYAMAADIAETVTDQITKAQYFEQKAFGSPGENRRGGHMRVAMNIDGANKPTEAFEDYSLIAVRQ